MEEVHINTNSSFNCFQRILCSLARFWERDFQMNLLETWGFKYISENEMFDDKLGLYWEKQFEWRQHLLNKFHGIDFYKLNTADKDNLDIKVDLSKEAVVFFLDTFECPWLPFYQKIHRQHCCLLVNADIDN